MPDGYGIKIEYITVTTNDVTKGVITDPEFVRRARYRIFSLEKLVPWAIYLRSTARRSSNSTIHPVFTRGSSPNGEKIEQPGHRAVEGVYLEGANSKKFSTTPTEFVTLIPTVYGCARMRSTFVRI